MQTRHFTRRCRQLCHQKIANNMSHFQHKQQVVNVIHFKARDKTYIMQAKTKQYLKKQKASQTKAGSAKVHQEEATASEEGAF